MQFVRMHLEDRKALPELFKEFNFDMVYNLATAWSALFFENLRLIDSNINGFLNVLECCRHQQSTVDGSSSSIYGNSDEVPFKESVNVDKPIGLSICRHKKSNELMYTYSHLYGIETINALQFMDPGEDPIWQCFYLPMQLITDL